MIEAGPRWFGAACEERGKEWFHWVVFGDDFTAILNVSMSAERGNTVARLTWLVDRDGWTGAVVPLPDARIESDGTLISEACVIAVHPSAATMRLRFSDVGAGVSGDFTFTGLQTPLRTEPKRLGAGSLNWRAFVDLRAHGEWRDSRQAHTFNRTPAYHDHNWGQFAWGDRVAWSWLIVPATNEGTPTILVSRVTWEGRPAGGGLILLPADRAPTIFADTETTVGSAGVTAASHAYRVPAIMRLAIPGQRVGLPREWRARAVRRLDDVSVVAGLDRLAQIAAPSPGDDTRVSLIDEGVGFAQVSTTIGGRERSWRAPCLLEQTRAVAC